MRNSKYMHHPVLTQPGMSGINYGIGYTVVTAHPYQGRIFTLIAMLGQLLPAMSKKEDGIAKVLIVAPIQDHLAWVQNLMNFLFPNHGSIPEKMFEDLKFNLKGMNIELQMLDDSQVISELVQYECIVIDNFGERDVLLRFRDDMHNYRAYDGVLLLGVPLDGWVKLPSHVTRCLSDATNVLEARRVVDVTGATFVSVKKVELQLVKDENYNFLIPAGPRA